jgi:ABC-type nitrate/sulfonate/bicarbonate transport system substrate-binding protein
MTPADVELVGTGFNDMPIALSTGTVEAAFLIEPILSVAENQGLAVRYVGVGYRYPDHVAAVRMLSPRFATENREAAAFWNG